MFFKKRKTSEKKLNVGIGVHNGKMVAAKCDSNKLTKNNDAITTNQYIELDLGNLKANIKSKFTGSLGCVCFCLQVASESLIGAYTKIALECGFEKVEVVENYALYAKEAMFNERHFISETDNVLIQFNEYISIWQGNNCLEIYSPGIKYDMSTVNPDIIIFNNKDRKTFFMEKFPDVILIFLYQFESEPIMALKRAQKMAGTLTDADNEKRDTENRIFELLEIFKNNERVLDKLDKKLETEWNMVKDINEKCADKVITSSDVNVCNSHKNSFEDSFQKLDKLKYMLERLASKWKKRTEELVNEINNQKNELENIMKEHKNIPNDVISPKLERLRKEVAESQKNQIRAMEKSIEIQEDFLYNVNTFGKTIADKYVAVVKLFIINGKRNIEVLKILINFTLINSHENKNDKKEVSNKSENKPEKIRYSGFSSLGENNEKSFYFSDKVLNNIENPDAVGIDLGTSRCCVAVDRKNGICTIPLDNKGERLFPSYVAYDEDDMKCGQIAVDRLKNYAKSTAFDSKRIIGRNIDDIEIDSWWPFQIINKNNEPLLAVKSPHGVENFTAEKVSADLLKHIKEKAEAFQGKSLTSAVITVPAAFTKAQNDATINAAKIAGWNNVILLPEPVAASFAYFIDRPIPDNSTVLLFDLGGGTLDVCIFKIQSGEFCLISNTGDTKLGGREFDTVLMNHFSNLLTTKYGISMVNKKYKLMLKSQEIKENLSQLKTCDFDVDEFDPSQDAVITISRQDFEKMTSQQLHKIRNTINAALYNAKYTANQINIVLRVGGGSKMPMVIELLKTTFPDAQHCCEENPDEVVAIGAAYYAKCSML